MKRTMSLSFYKRKFLSILNLNEIELEIFKHSGAMVTLRIDMELHINGASSEHIMKAEEVLQCIILEKEVKCKSESYANKEWKIFKTLIKAKFNQRGKRFEIFEVIPADEIPGIFKVILVGFIDPVCALEEIISDFLDNLVTTTETLPLSACQLQLFEELKHHFDFQQTRVRTEIQYDMSNTAALIKGPKRDAALAMEIVACAIPLYSSFIRRNQQCPSDVDSTAGYCFSLIGGRNLTISMDDPEMQDIHLIVATDTEDFPSHLKFSDSVSFEEEYLTKNHIAVMLNSETVLTRNGRYTKKVTATVSAWNHSENAIYSYRSLETCLKTAVCIALEYAERQQFSTLGIQLQCSSSEMDNGLFSVFINSILPAIDNFSRCWTLTAFLQTISIIVDDAHTLNKIRAACRTHWPFCALTQNSLPSIFSPWEVFKTDIVTGFIEDSRADVFVMHVSFTGAAPTSLTTFRKERSKDLNIMLEVASEVAPSSNREITAILTQKCIDLACTCVFAVTLDELEDSPERPHQMLRRIISSCLERCHNSFFKSIVFPVFDLRRFGMSFAQTIEVITEQITRFRVEKPSTWIRTVKIVLPPEYISPTQIFEEIERSTGIEVLGLIISDCPVFITYLRDNADAASELDNHFQKLGFYFNISESLNLNTISEDVTSKTWVLDKIKALELVFYLTKTKYQIHIEHDPSLSALLEEGIWRRFQSIRVYEENIVVGQVDEVRELQKALHEAHRDRCQESRVCKIHSMSQYVLINRILANELSEPFPNLRHSVVPALGLLQLEGCHREVCLAEEIYNQLLEKLIPYPVHLSEYKSRFLQSLDSQSFTQEYLLSRDFHAILEAKEHIELYGLSHTVLSQAKEHLDTVICLNVINITAELQWITDTDEWDFMVFKLKESMNQQSRKIDVYTKQEANSSANVNIVGFQNEVHEAEVKIKHYINNFMLVEDRIADNRPELLRAGSAILKLFRETNVNVALEAAASSSGLSVVLRGRRRDVQRAKVSIQEDLSSIVFCTELMSPGAMRYLSGDGSEILWIVEDCFHCILKLGTLESPELLIIGKSDHVTKAKASITRILCSLTLSQDISDPLISTFTEEYIAELQDKCLVSTEKRGNSITVTGLAKDVHEFCTHIQSRLTSLQENEIECLEEEYKQAQGREFLLRTESNCIKQTKESLEEQINALREEIKNIKKEANETESLLQQQMTTFQTRIKEKKQKYKERKSLFFTTVQQLKQAVHPDSDLQSIRLPSMWTDIQPQPDKVTVQPNTEEYNRVKANFMATCSQYTIINIERIQNKLLRYAYELKKKAMETKNGSGGSNEQVVFHGTTENTCKSINKHGFNRNYTGKNGTAYGHGVYFTKDASTSDPYSGTNTSGHRCMYQAVILAGKYAIGRFGMWMPPTRSPTDPTDLYDSVVNSVLQPSLYVIFHDDQAYPEYLITYTRTI